MATARENTSANLPQEVATYYEKVFLARAEYNLVAKEGGQIRTHASGEGKTINFTRYVPLTVNLASGLITEGSNPLLCAITASTISMGLCEYGLTVQTTKFLSTISIDKGMSEKIALVGAHMGEYLNRLVLNELTNGTAAYPNSKNASTYAASDVFAASCINDVIKTLELNKAMEYPDGMFIGKAPPQSKYRLMKDSTWVNAHTYKDGKELYKGEMGELFQVRWLLNKDYTSAVGDASEASAVASFDNFIHGAESFGVYDLDGDKPRLYILPNLVDSGSPAGRISKISWAGSYATKILNSDWVIRLRTPA
jgi:N4-gp56 family major capsid protein